MKKEGFNEGLQTTHLGLAIELMELFQSYALDHLTSSTISHYVSIEPCPPVKELKRKRNMFFSLIEESKDLEKTIRDFPQAFDNL